MGVETYAICGQQAWTRRVYELCATVVIRERWLFIETAQQLDYALQNTASMRYLFFLHWSQILPRRVWQLHECVNFHCTPLPYGRGGHPIENMIRHGQDTTTMTAHAMVDQIDAGEIYTTYSPISLRGSRHDILDRFVYPCAAMVRSIVDGAVQETYAQKGKIVRFSRLKPNEIEELWRTRS